MAQAIIMPRQGQSVESCIITAWHKKPGDKVSAGDLLFSYETDKASFDEECPVSGYLLGAFFEEGDDVPCLTNVCAVGQPGEAFDQFRPSAAVSSSVTASEPLESPQLAAPEAPQSAALSSAAVEGSRNSPVAPQEPAASLSNLEAPAKTRISPRALSYAKRMGADIAAATGTGPQGRILQRDIQALVDKGQVVTPAAQGMGTPLPQGTAIGGRTGVMDLAVREDTSTLPTAVEAPSASQPIPQPPREMSVSHPLPYTDEPLTNLRKTIARTMHASLQNIPQLTHTASFDATRLLALRKRFKESGEALGLAHITLNDLILFAVSRTLPLFPALNAHRMDNALRVFSDVHLGMAVDTPRGLLVPTIFYADRLSLKSIHHQAAQLAEACQTGAISPDYLQGATFTVSNLGSLGIEHFTPVINPPQTGILGVNTLTQHVRQGANGLELYSRMALSLTYDHGALDGALASRFLQALCKNMEQLDLLLAQ